MPSDHESITGCSELKKETFILLDFLGIGKNRLSEQVTFKEGRQATSRQEEIVSEGLCRSRGT